MPEVVSQVEALEAGARHSSSSNGNGASSNGAARTRLKTWAAAPSLFPCDASPVAKQAVKEVSFQRMIHLLVILRTSVLFLGVADNRFT